MRCASNRDKKRDATLSIHIEEDEIVLADSKRFHHSAWAIEDILFEFIHMLDPFNESGHAL